MREDQDDGGSAFPSHGSMGEVEHRGMSLRDWFAGQALAGLSVEIVEVLPIEGEPVEAAQKQYWAGVAEAAYWAADAMLEARK